jgi:hypothetical protein
MGMIEATTKSDGTAIYLFDPPVWKVIVDECGDEKLSRVEECDPEGWTDTGFRGTYFECCRYVDEEFTPDDLNV